jgi:hypothetical protein
MRDIFTNISSTQHTLESEARLSRSFWGLVSRGHGFVELNGKDPMGGATVPLRGDVFGGRERE